ncbi:Uncharacterized protein Rs2_17735 [Raphanus sativus]|uniref:Uncharacterized protein LOC108852356 n=1 Tax=Raphanus sativus TaxID=3726 RepID=A0A6J0NA18_RAPSA|nr:uncharacterized protein LOC108852356 [Raphanus sativus]KAJ4903784.1 Uncharacterized protein Rs2_17735 [Raphanus sativus]
MPSTQMKFSDPGGGDDPLPFSDAPVDVEANTDAVNELERAGDMVSSPPLSQRAHADDVGNVNNSAAQTGSCPADGVQGTPSPCVDNNSPPPVLVPEANSNLDDVQTNLAFPKPTFLLGLTQEERQLSKTDS